MYGGNDAAWCWTSGENNTICLSTILASPTHISCLWIKTSSENAWISLMLQWGTVSTQTLVSEKNTKVKEESLANKQWAIHEPTTKIYRVVPPRVIKHLSQIKTFKERCKRALPPSKAFQRKYCINIWPQSQHKVLCTCVWLRILMSLGEIHLAATQCSYFTSFCAHEDSWLLLSDNKYCREHVLLQRSGFWQFKTQQSPVANSNSVLNVYEAFTGSSFVSAERGDLGRGNKGWQDGLWVLFAPGNSFHSWKAELKDGVRCSIQNQFFSTVLPYPLITSVVQFFFKNNST